MALNYTDLTLPPGTGTTPTAPQPDIGPVSTIGSGVLDFIRSIKGTSVADARTAALAADPFAPQRGGYQADLRTTMDNPANTYMGKLNTLLSNPGSFQTDPGYQFAKEQGLEGVARHGNAMFGGTRSGNTAVALDKYGTGFAEQAYDTRVQQLLAGAGQEQTNYNQRINSLLTASGANQGNPGEAGKIIAGGYANQQRDQAGALRGADALLNMLMKSGMPQALAQQIAKAFGNADPSNVNLSGSTDDFLRSIGIQPTAGIETFMHSPFDPDASSMPTDQQLNIFDPTGTNPLQDYNPNLNPNIDLSTSDIINDVNQAPPPDLSDFIPTGGP